MYKFKEIRPGGLIPSAHPHPVNDREFAVLNGGRIKDSSTEIERLKNPIPIPKTSVNTLLMENAETSEDAFYIADYGEVKRRLDLFNTSLPRVTPFYAMKCNPEKSLLKEMVSWGLSFDCASKNEIKSVIELGVDPEKIIFANPCKQVSHIRYAKEVGVKAMTFDNHDELYKIKKIYPEAKLVLRVRTDDSKAVCRLSLKFGAEPSITLSLLQLAKSLELNVVGVSFHVGSGCFDPNAYVDAVYRAYRIFKEAKELGMNLSLLDIGGGFSGLDGVDGCPFSDIAKVLGPKLDELFPEDVTIIAEPGRFFVAKAFSLAVSVIARRQIARDDSGDDLDCYNGSTPTADENPSFMYYVNNGVYSGFNCTLFDHAKVHAEILKRTEKEFGGDEVYECSIWGPTCDSMDCISKNELLPELEVGDWLVYRNMGAYTMAAGSEFNGFEHPKLIWTNTY